LASRGIDVVALPLTKVAPPPPAQWQELVALVGSGHDAVAIASANAAEALVRAATEAAAARGLGEVSWLLPHVVSVGTVTVGVLARHGIASIAAARADATGLADELIARGARRVLWPRAEDGRDEGLVRLAAAGVAVDAPVAYRTVAVPADAPEVVAGLAALAGAVALCVYAPSQVDALDALVPLAALEIPIVAIGETTAAALRARGARVAAIASAPDPDAMASAVAAVLPTSS
jgi:uroporphyrinogen-III synthase